MTFTLLLTYIGAILRYALIILAILACIKYLRAKP